MSRYKFYGEQVVNQGTQGLIESRGAVWICLVLLSCLEGRNALQKM